MIGLNVILFLLACVNNNFVLIIKIRNYLMFNIKKVLCVTIMPISISAMTFADIVFKDDFDSSSAVVLPSGDDSDPVASLGSWNIFESDPEGAQVATEGIGAYNGCNYLSLNRWEAVSNGGGCVEVGAQLNQTVTDNMIITFAFNNVAGDHTVEVRNDSQTGAAAKCIILHITEDGRLVNEDVSNAKSATGLVYSSGEWNEIRMEIDFAAKKYDLYLNAQKIEELDFYWPMSTDQANRVLFYNPMTTIPSNILIDNVIIETGESFCSVPLANDFNGDCKVDLSDFSKMASSWLDCNLLPIEDCD